MRVEVIVNSLKFIMPGFSGSFCMDNSGLGFLISCLKVPLEASVGRFPGTVLTLSLQLF